MPVSRLLSPVPEAAAASWKYGVLMHQVTSPMPVND